MRFNTILFGLAALAIASALYFGYSTSPNSIARAVVRVQSPSVEPVFPGDADYSRIEVALPAVDEEGGGKIATAMVERLPGQGRLLLSIGKDEPKLDEETQTSLQLAVDEARRLVGKQAGAYDLRFSLSAPGTVISGRSAGAAFAAASAAVLTGIHLRQDTAVTGAILPGGGIGRVGAVYEKALAIQKAGYRRLVVPKGEAQYDAGKEECTESRSNDDNTIIRKCITRALPVNVGDETGLQVIEVETLSQAIAAMRES